MVGRRAEKSVQIRSYIKIRHELGLKARAIHNEICRVYGANEVSYRTVDRWISKFKSGQQHIEDSARPGRKCSVVTPKIIEKIKELLVQDARYTTRDIASKVGVSTGTAFVILKKILKVRRIAARWIPHLLTDKQKQERVKMARKLLKMYPEYDSRTFADIVTGDETWVHFFEPHRKISNKIWATKHARRPSIAKRTMSAKKIMYAIFFNNQGPVVQIPVPRGRTVTGAFYKQKILKSVKKHYSKRRPATGMKGLRLIHDNAPSHKSHVVTEFLSKEKVTVLPYPPYSPDMAPCDFFLFPRLKKHISGRRYTSRKALGSAIFQCLRGIPKEDYIGAFRKWIKRLKLCISARADYFEGMK